jgi:dipeptidase
MCDTMAARGRATTTGAMLFAKNSDRERNEAQLLELLPARDYGEGARLRVTYVTIPQVARTHAVLLSRPFWIWGAEMGANEHGVVIGNEAVHPRLLPQRKAALIGMDLLRLGLERGASAKEALDVITALLERHGQGGNCSHLGRRYYDNSFIIADRDEAYVLESVGRHWAAERITATRAISNTYTIGAQITRASDGLQSFTRKQGWWRGRGAFDFADIVTSLANPGLAGARSRCSRATALLAEHMGRIDSARMMANLRDHGAAAEGQAGWHPQSLTGPTICMHGGDGIVRGQSVGAMVSDLRPRGAVHWLTGTSAPCTSIFKPVFIDAGLQPQGAIPGDRYDERTLWWRHERLHRALLHGDYARGMAEIAPERDTLEANFRGRVEEVLAMRGPAGIRARRRIAERCWREAAAAEARWLRIVPRIAAARTRPAYRRSWRRFDKLSGMNRTL